MKKMLELYRSSLRELASTRNLVLCGLMAAIGVILGMVATINLGPYIRIGFSGLPNRMVDCLFGPVVGCIFGGVLDVLKYLLNPTGPFFFGFTLNAMLSGMIYGTILYQKPISWKRIIAAEFLVKLLINCGLSTLWLSMLYGDAFLVLLPPRVLKNAIMLPVDSIILFISLNLVRQVAQQLGFFQKRITA